MAQEYRRTCKACGTVWHSLASREKTIQEAQQVNALNQGSPDVTVGGFGAP